MNICECIEWYDHSSYTDCMWRSVKEIEHLSPRKVLSVGFVIKETPKYLTMVSHIIEDDEGMHGEMCILKSTIFARHNIRVTNKVKKKLNKEI